MQPMVRSEETDVADSTELQGLCFCAQPQGTEALREGGPGSPVKWKGNAHQLRHTWKPQRRQPGTKDFPDFIIPRLGVPLVNA